MRDDGKFRVDRNHTKIMNLLSEQTLSEMTQQSVSFGQEGLGYSNINNDKKNRKGQENGKEIQSVRNMCFW